MAKIYELRITNFRGIPEFRQVFNQDFVCLIGRGDSGKSTILEAISLVLSPAWNHNFYDSDFHKYQIENPIEIEVSLTNLPEELIVESKFGLHIRSLDRVKGMIYDEYDEFQDNHECLLTIKLIVDKYLEPKWYVINKRQEPKEITHTDRAKLNTFLISDYIDRHFSWGKGNPLYSILKSEEPDSQIDKNILVDASRLAKEEIDKYQFNEFVEVSKKIQNEASLIGLDITELKSSIDFRDISIKDGRICLHDEEKIPLKLRGKGSKRLLSIAIQTAIEKNGGVILIDEIEQGLEPDRVQHLVSYLKHHPNQVFITTHSRNVLVELDASDLFLMRQGISDCITFDKTFQAYVRGNPEAFFAIKIIVCEGKTEIGICRALDSFRISNTKENMSHLGVVYANGGGSPYMLQYCDAFIKAGFKTCLFCDYDKKGSDLNSEKKEKERLKKLGVQIIDWAEGDCSEVAIAKDIPYSALKEMLKLAADIVKEKENREENEIRKSIWSSIETRFGNGCPSILKVDNDSIKLRTSIGITANEQGWFKLISSGERLGNIIFKYYSELSGEYLKQRLDELSKWIDE